MNIGAWVDTMAKLTHLQYLTVDRLTDDVFPTRQLAAAIRGMSNLQVNLCCIIPV